MGWFLHENDVDTTLIEVENVINKTFMPRNDAYRISLNLYIFGITSFTATFNLSTFNYEKKSREPLYVQFKDQKC